MPDLLSYLYNLLFFEYCKSLHTGKERSDTSFWIKPISFWHSRPKFRSLSWELQLNYLQYLTFGGPCNYQKFACSKSIWTIEMCGSFPLAACSFLAPLGQRNMASFTWSKVNTKSKTICLASFNLNSTEYYRNWHSYRWSVFFVKVVACHVVRLGEIITLSVICFVILDKL